MEINDNLLTLYDKAQSLPQKGLSLQDQIEAVGLRYLSSEPAGQGGMKKILRSKDEITGRKVAMAMLVEEKPENGMIENFLREARITAALQHPNIVPVYDIGINEEALPYFTMKLLEGKPLDVFLEKPHPVNELVEIFKKICDGVAYAHSRGVIHLDLKPANVYIGRFGDVIICDWGLARLINSDENESLIIDDDSLDKAEITHMTLNGEVKGTPGFMAPEQARTKSFKDQRTDIFSLGALLYCMLTGKPPFEGKTLEEIREKTINTTPIPPSSLVTVPASLDAICMKALAPKPIDRYASVENIIKEIDNFQAGFATEAENAGFIRQLQLMYKRHQLLCLAAITVLITAITATVIYINQQQENLIIVQDKEQKAIDALKKYKEQKEDNEKLGKMVYKNYFGRAQAHFLKFERDNALENVSLALQYKPDHNESNSLMGKLLMTQWKFKEAKKFLLRGTAHQNKFFIPICEDYEPKKLPGSGFLSHQDFISLIARTPITNTVVKYLMIEIFDQKMTTKERVELVKTILEIRNPLQRNIDIKYDVKTQTLDLSNNHQLNNIDALTFLPLKHLNLSHTNVAELDQIQNHKLISLNVSNTKVGRFRYVKPTNAKKLNLSNTTFALLKNLPENLEWLDLRNTKVNSFKELKNFTKLKTLFIDEYKLNAKEKKMLKTLLENNQ